MIKNHTVSTSDKLRVVSLSDTAIISDDATKLTYRDNYDMGILSFAEGEKPTVYVLSPPNQTTYRQAFSSVHSQGEEFSQIEFGVALLLKCLISAENFDSIDDLKLWPKGIPVEVFNTIPAAVQIDLALAALFLCSDKKGGEPLEDEKK